MEVGRNDPCPCGSGKKYKNCHMRQNQAEERGRQAAGRSPQVVDAPVAHDLPQSSIPPTSPAARPLDPHEAAWDGRWKEFEALTDLEDRIALFFKTLDEETLMDAEMAFEMLNVIFHESVKRDERDRFDPLVDRLRERLPEVYAHDAHYYLDWRISNALAAGRLNDASVLADEMAPLAGKHIDTFDNVLDRLAYHGQLSTLLSAMQKAWPQVKTSGDIVPWGIDEFAENSADDVVFDYLERNPTPDARDPELIEQLEFYHKINRNRLSRYIAHLTGQAERSWTMNDFDFKRRRSSDDFDDEEDEEERASRDGGQNLFDLSVEFLGYLRHTEGVPYTKGELGREQIQRYILERYAGELEPQPSMLEAVMHPRQHRRRSRPRRPAHLLCPDRQTLDRFLAGLLHFINPQYYKSAATLELVPAWLRFLESRRLIDSQQRTQTLLELRGLDTELLKLLEATSVEPAVLAAMRQWRENAAILLPFYLD